MLEILLTYAPTVAAVGLALWISWTVRGRMDSMGESLRDEIRDDISKVNTQLTRIEADVKVIENVRTSVKELYPRLEKHTTDIAKGEAHREHHDACFNLLRDELAKIDKQLIELTRVCSK